MNNQIRNGTLKDIYYIARQTRSPERVHRVMKETTKSTIKVLKKWNTKATLTELNNKHILTKTVFDQCKNICTGLPHQHNKTKEIGQLIMQWKEKEAKYQLDHEDRSNAKKWKESKKVLQEHRINRDFNQIWQ